MRKTKIIITLLCFWFGLMPLAAQSVTITKDFAQVPMASVLAMYKNEFGSYEKPDMTDTFPYAVIRMHLEGSGQSVREAKERLTLYMGQQMGVERRVTTYSNQILFLVRSRHPMIYIDCGDGCERVLLSNMQQLKSNCVYDCTVRYEPEKLNTEEAIDKEKLKQELLAELAAVLKGQRGDNITQSDELSNPVIQSETEPIDFNLIDSAPSNDGGVETFTIRGVSFNMIKVQGGTFTMGATSEQGSDANDWEKPTHQVTLSDYYIGETEVTQELWQAVMGTTIQEQAKKGTYDTSLYGVGNSYPMYYISWDDCQTFVTKLNQLTGKNFRLPTEAEWEYAARGGQKSKGYKYAGSNTLSDVAWYLDNSSSKTHPVKQKQANELGLYDMTGNVWEWCQDRYGNYGSAAQTNPTGPSSGSYRVLRGGSWDNSTSCRVAYRGGNSPGGRSSDLGFRVVLLP